MTRAEGMARVSRARSSESGQALVLMVGVILAAVAMVGLIVDGGNVLSQQRIVQSGSDATAEAGAVLLAQRLAGADMPTGGWDANIAAKLSQTAAANNMSIGAAYYTDICGIPLKADGTAAMTADFHEDLGVAMEVGNALNALPAAGATTPDCPNHIVGPVAGVLVLGEKVVPSFVARAINIASFTVTTRAAAVAGYLQGYCDASQGKYCALLPIAIPVNALGCNGTSSPVDSGVPWSWNTILKVPLCSTAAGNVGWIDWDPVSGGAGDVVCSILYPDNPSIDLPSWQYVAQAGNSNGGGGTCSMTLEEAIRTHSGETVLVPQFDLVCAPNNNDGDPDSSQPPVITPPNYGCPVSVGTGGGQLLWYRMPSFAFFQLCGSGIPGCNGLQPAYIGGNNGHVCDTGNGATSCLVGRFVNILATGTVGSGVGSGTGNKALGVQLIK